ncbi:hypothetical protein [Mesorhizobium sp. B2-6-4]|uniref:hypothetical protein n=1 Tax=Mesorhizobium sp. B2-6-4 TaxID=2589913 RepID=UPI00112D279D|nr:hypothetical protein [Mesorhizobium sp. B2-6-4]TPJ52331.1 hypothetical protein FJ426_16445 [Mesorhizobium sp. B2-6-4]
MDMPASLGGRLLIGRPKDRAEAARVVLEWIHKGKVVAGSMLLWGNKGLQPARMSSNDDWSIEIIT